VRPDTAGLPPVTIAAPPDTSAAPDSGAGGIVVADTTHAHQVPPGTPGKVTLQGIPAGARVTINGQPVKGTQFDLPSGVHKLAVRAPGFDVFERQIAVTPGAQLAVKVELRPLGEAGGAGAGAGAGPCEQYGPAYNQDNLCFDSRPVPLSSTLVSMPADAPVIPREAILLFHVARTGETMSVRLFVRSNVETFNDQALDIAKTLHWNPAQKNGEPVDAWVQWPFKPVPVR
jgi:hypothetical protein